MTTRTKRTAKPRQIEALIGSDRGLLKELMKEALQEVLEAEMYVQGVSTRKVKAITAELCGHTFSASTVSRINKSLDALLRRFAQRQLDEAYPYLILDARYEKVRLDGVIQSQAVFIALGINDQRGGGGRCWGGVNCRTASRSQAGRPSSKG